MTRFFHILSFLLIVLLFFTNQLVAGTTGKIVGTVVDKKSGEPLPGAAIRILNTYLGASADVDGQFIILNVPPGIYDVEVSMLGYKTVLKKNVKVSVDLTTILHFALEETPIEAEEVVVEAKRPLVQKDITSRQAYIEGSMITELPVRDFKEVLSLQAGVTRDASGRIHIRGGRSGEVAFLIDGVYVDDPLQGGFGSELGESSQSRQRMEANLGVVISDEAIDEMVVISGTFNAEYGNVMSGVVNIVTKEPSTHYTGKLEYTSDYLNTSPYRRLNAIVPDKNPIIDAETGKRLYFHPPSKPFQGFPTMLPIPGQFQGSLSGPVPGIKKLSFFFSGKYSNQDSHLPHGFDLQRSYFSKLTFFASPLLKLNYTENFSRRIFQVYDHAWKYLPQNQGINWLTQRRHIFSFTHTLSPKAFYILNLAYSTQESIFGVWDWQNHRFRDPETEYEKGEKDNELEFYVRGTDDLYLRSRSRVFSVKGDLSYQMGMHHEWKTGFEVRYHDLYSYKRIEPWPEEGGANRTITFHKFPLEAALYLQDKIEYDYLIINAGLRLDYVDVRAKQWRHIDNPLSGLVEAPVRYQLSPRLGIALPIMEGVVFHFAYGHFFQYPNYADIYTNLEYQNPELMAKEAFVIVGNPGVKPQKTVSYEAGLKYQLGAHSSFEVTAYFKDLTNLLGTHFYRRQLIYRYSVYTNLDYGSVKGIDFSWQVRFPGYFSSIVNYTYSVAMGNSSFPTEQAYNAYYQMEEAHQEYPLDFDRRHNISASLTFSYPFQTTGPWWKRYVLSGLGLNFVIQYASGFPYTPITDDPTLFIKPNSARMPWTGTVDMRLEKRWRWHGLQFGVFTEISNLFNRLNALYVQPFTGRLWDTGKLELLATGTDFVHDPSDAGPPRLIHVGALINF